MKIVVANEQEAQAVRAICSAALRLGALDIAEAAVVMSKSIEIQTPDVKESKSGSGKDK